MRVICVKTDYQLNNVAIAFKRESIAHFIFFFLIGIFSLKSKKIYCFVELFFTLFLSIFFELSVDEKTSIWIPDKLSKDHKLPAI